MENKEQNMKSERAEREEKVLEFWKENKIFEKSLEKDAPKGEFVFFEGPPTANGKPGIHHLEARSFKDAIPRYKTMQGFHVRRKGGWDTHGLPVELQVEKKLGLNSKKAIEEYGIAKFNQECKESVWEYTDLWDKFTERVGYWVDRKNAYVTYHNDFIESVWNIVKKVNEQKLLYKDYKVVPWCPRCGTTLSSHELAQGYEDVKDLSLYVKFKVKGEENTYILAWTTTPWTLPGNVGLAVGEDIDYVKVKYSGSTLEAGSGDKNGKVIELVVSPGIYILAKSRISILPSGYKILEEIKGRDLVGLEYEPLFPYLADTISDGEKDKLKNAYKVYVADFVTTEDGTGVVHTAVMYGQDDFVLGTAVGLPKHHLVNLEGKFIKGTDFLESRFVKEVDENGKPTLAVDIIKYLTDKNLFFKKENYEHSYPHCWRCHTALIYYARDSWYIRMSTGEIKEKLISENKEIKWEPAHIRDGRFGEWLREIKDWAISRERYWGTPLPVWSCASCKTVHVMGSVEEIKEKTKKSGNTYTLMRHGESESNVKGGKHGVVSSVAENVDHLTKDGEEQVRKTAEKLKDEKFDLVFVSPFMRTEETVAILKDVLKLKDEQIIVDKRLGELYAGDFEGKSWDEYRGMFKDERDRFLNAIHGGESLLDMKRRVGEFITETEDSYAGKNILIISHGAALWLMYAVQSGYDVDESITMTGGVFRHAEQLEDGTPVLYKHFDNAEIRRFDFVPVSLNRDYELDLHRPYIDELKLVCECGGDLVRTPEVMDVWFDSGAMPFAQDHYPFENKDWVDGSGYPADFISEAIDQTRGWFYTLHAVGVLMGRGKAYKNVICLGHLLDANGKKMSKSLGNVVDPWTMMDKYGVDTLRLWMYSVNQPGESKNFDEKTVSLVHSQVFGLLYNVLAFYELYRDKDLEENGRPRSENILDIWILGKFDELVNDTTKHLDDYKLLEPVRAIRSFVGDLSTWYLRRSRERIKDGDKDAKVTLYYVLKNLIKVMAPFAPFASEDIWMSLKNEKDVESVHLAEWPKGEKVDTKTLEDMEQVREIVSLGLKERQKVGLPVRQPLSELKVKNYKSGKEYEEIIKDELNIKSFSSTEGEGELELELDTQVTQELKVEGNYRELVRALQDMRKKMGLTPSEAVSITFDTSTEGQNLVKKFEEDIKKTVLVSKVEFSENQGEEIKIDSLVFKVKIDKI